MLYKLSRYLIELFTIVIFLNKSLSQILLLPLTIQPKQAQMFHQIISTLIVLRFLFHLHLRLAIYLIYLKDPLKISSPSSCPGWWEGNLPSIPFQIYFRRYLPRIKIWLPSITAKSSQENYLFEMRNHFWNASGQRRESGLMSIESDELCLKVENKGLVVAGRGGCYWQWMTIGHRQPREKHNSVFWSSQWYLSF